MATNVVSQTTVDLRELPLDKIVVDDTLSTRAELDYWTSQKYIALYAEDPSQLPPLDVFTHDGGYLLADGFHRHHAAGRAGVPTLPCRIFVGSRRDAFLHSVRTNAQHQGLPYRQQDVTRIVRWALVDGELSTWSYRAIARLIGCSHTWVNDIAKRVQAERTVASALGVESVSAPGTKAKYKERQQVAAFFDLPKSEVRRAEVPYATDRLIRAVADGQTLEEAKETVRKDYLSPPPPLPAVPIPPEEVLPGLPPPSAATLALETLFAEQCLRALGLGDTSWVPPYDAATICIALSAACVTGAALLSDRAIDLQTGLARALERVQEALGTQIQALAAWQDSIEGMKDPSTLRAVVDHLIAHRYDHSPATARTVGDIIVALETYLAEHAPSSTGHPDRRRVEMGAWEAPAVAAPPAIVPTPPAPPRPHGPGPQVVISTSPLRRAKAEVEIVTHYPGIWRGTVLRSENKPSEP
jgi:hypothetical protein